jgi:hypothetical protein
MFQSATGETKSANSRLSLAPVEHFIHSTQQTDTASTARPAHLLPQPCIRSRPCIALWEIRQSYGGLTSLRPTIQTKLTINTPGDQYEQEANRVAKQMMRIPDPFSACQRLTLGTVAIPAGAVEMSHKTSACPPT